MLKSVEDPQVAGDDAAPTRRPGGVVTALRAIVQAALMLAVLGGSYLAMERLIAAAPERTARPQPDVSVPVEAVIVAAGDERPNVSLYGEVTAARAVDVRPPVSGEVIAIHPDLSAGRRIEAGDTLFEIDPFDLEVALAEARADLAQTEATIAENEARLVSERSQLESAREQLELARSDLARAEQLRGNGTLTAKQVEDRELIVSQREQAVSQRVNNIAIEEARLEQQRAIRTRLDLGVRRAERDLGNTTVRAPFSGVVRSSTVETGRIVAANDVAVAMYDDSALDVRFTLTDAQYGRIATDADPLIGRDVRLVWTVGNLDYTYTGTVNRIGADIASARGGVDAYARIDATEAPVQLRPGAFVSVTVPDRLYEDAVRLPETALYDAGTMYVVAGGQLERRTVEVAAFEGADVIVTGGLAAGEQVMTTRLSNVEDGLKVTVPGAEPTQTDDGSTPVAEARPSEEMIAAAKRLSGLTDAQWEALSRDERRAYLRQLRDRPGAAGDG
ncbi:MAG: efflux RND transporter periplasmic adaptor subunit [Roseitalea sp.]|jgi:RND family efflux transporter MFP subunit|nr:efflux RND transporter periplasmic adaptor subunit [Roseitalea sp.]MBO6722876.1 efflux RND transporter periplasmic adaptor subunit [Roseitalea sp.]MBO6743009.1 efflux RND transporter periplasmic adaptor subunit [Roseitalea sp.]